MKSSQEHLKKRGFLEETDLEAYRKLPVEELKELLRSSKARERTAAARLLGMRPDLSEPELCDLLLPVLAKEKSLYTRLEICIVLERCGMEAAKRMAAYLGKIGKNQHHSLPGEVSRKVSYPLPRDIIARTLGKMNHGIMPVLLSILKQGELSAVQEVIDAIGFLCFYNQVPNREAAIEALFKCYHTYYCHDVIRWKLMTAFSAFQEKSVISFLEKVGQTDSRELIRKEAVRSLALIGDVK